MRNTVALGAAVALFAMDFRHVESAFKDIWGDKKPEIVQQNVAAAKLGGDAVKDMGGPLPLGLAYPNQAKYLMTGNEAVCLGALAAGVKFLAQYPMTPASSILHWMAAHGPKYGVVVKQVEDELAAMNMAVGAGFAGVRSMTATSGGGFSLMVEAIGQAGMTETPLVAVLVQRSGPSRGRRATSSSGRRTSTWRTASSSPTSSRASPSSSRSGARCTRSGCASWTGSAKIRPRPSCGGRGMRTSP